MTEIEKLRQQKNRKKRCLVTAAIAVMVLAGAAVAVLLSQPLMQRKAEDKNAKEMGQQALTAGELSATLQQQADESRFRVLLNTAPVSEDGQTADWCIMNTPSNGYDMQVVISTEDGITLYTGEALPPGGEVLTGPIEGDLPEGTYPATAVAYAIDRETGESVGEVTIDITVTIGPSTLQDSNT